MAYKNPEEKRAKNREWARLRRLRDPEKARALDTRGHITQKLNGNQRRKWVLWKYGLAPQDHIALLESQNYRCALPSCGNEVTFQSGHIDHNHASGAVRGILCKPHNMGLGLFEKLNPHCLSEAEEYLVRTRNEN